MGTFEMKSWMQSRIHDKLGLIRKFNTYATRRVFQIMSWLNDNFLDTI